MTPAILRTTGGNILVPEAWGLSTAELLTEGAFNMTLAEVLSMFSQTEPVCPVKLAGQMSIGERDPIHITGKLFGLDMRLTVEDADSVERYRLHSQSGWFYGVFSTDRFSRLEVLVEGVWVEVAVVG